MRCRSGWAGAATLVVAAGLVGACNARAPSALDGVPSAGGVTSASATPATRPPPWSGVGPFELYLSDFHFELGGTQILAVDDAGRVRDMFVKSELVTTEAFCADAGGDVAEVCKDLRKRGETKVGTTRWFIAEYTLDDAAKTALRSALTAAKMTTLEPRYAKSKIPDGTTRDYRLVANDGAAKVSAYSVAEPAEPPELLAVLRLVQDAQKTNSAARARAKEIAPADRMAFEREATGP